MNTERTQKYLLPLVGTRSLFWSLLIKVIADKIAYLLILLY